MEAIWLTTNQRSGSNYLSALVTEVCRLPDHLIERFHEIEKIDQTLYKKPRYFKYSTIHYHQFELLQLSIEQIECFYPGIRFIELKRNDILAKAISLYFANSTNEFILLRKDSWWLKDINNEFINREDERLPLPKLNKSLLLECYEKVKNLHDKWENILPKSKTIKILYEDVQKEPLKELKKISEFLDLPYDEELAQKAVSSCPVLKTKRPEYEEYEEILKSLINRD